MRLDDALNQIEHMRHAASGGGVFRSCRALPVAASGALAFVGAGGQAIWLPDPSANLTPYLFLWVGIATLSLLLAGISIWRQCHMSGSVLARDTAWVVIERFVPFLVAGAMLTAVIAVAAIEVAWMLPGLWAILFGLGVLAKWRLLPRASFWVGGYYLCAGLVCVGFAQGPAALAPWTMAMNFGVGQCRAALVIYVSLERQHG